MFKKYGKQTGFAEPPGYVWPSVICNYLRQNPNEAERVFMLSPDKIFYMGRNWSYLLALLDIGCVKALFVHTTYEGLNGNFSRT